MGLLSAVGADAGGTSASTGGSLAPSIIGGGASLVGDILNLFGQSKANRDAQQFSRDTMNLQRNWALQDRDYQNEYNSPMSQMARLKEAGLNPNLVYGEGITATGQSEQPRSVQSADYHPQNDLSAFSNLGQQLMAAASLGTSMEKTKADTSQVKANTKAQEMLNQIQSDSPEIAGFKYTDPQTGKLVELSAPDFIATMKGAFPYQAQTAAIEIANATARITENKSDIEFFNKEIAKASYQPTLQAAMQVGKQALLNLVNSQKDSDLKTQQLKNLQKAWDSMDSTIKSQEMEREWRKGNFGNNAILQGLFHAAVMAGIALL